MARNDKVDYGPHEDDTFDVGVELGARDQRQQRVLEHDPRRRFEFKVKSSSDEAEELIHEPLAFLLRHQVPGVRRTSRITTTIHHHERGMRWRIIRASATVEQSSGDVAMELDKET